MPCASGDKRQPEIVRRLAIDAFFDTVNTLDLMRTSTELISEISAPTISTSFKFHLVDFLVNLGEVDVYRVYVCTLLSRSLVTPRHRFVMMHEVDDRFEVTQHNLTLL